LGGVAGSWFLDANGLRNEVETAGQSRETGSRGTSV
jgi:hypothetical protein